MLGVGLWSTVLIKYVLILPNRGIPFQYSRTPLRVLSRPIELNDAEIPMKVRPDRVIETLFFMVPY